MSANLNLKNVKDLIATLTGQDNIITCPRLFIELTGDHMAALVLNELLFWTGKSKDKDGWVYRSEAQWFQTLLLTRGQITRAIEKLEPLGIQVKLKRANGAPTKHYRIDEEVFYNKLMAYIENPDPKYSRFAYNVKIAKCENHEMRKSQNVKITEYENGFAQNVKMDLHKTLNSLTVGNTVGINTVGNKYNTANPDRISVIPGSGLNTSNDQDTDRDTNTNFNRIISNIQIADPRRYSDLTISNLALTVTPEPLNDQIPDQEPVKIQPNKKNKKSVSQTGTPKVDLDLDLEPDPETDAVKLYNHYRKFFPKGKRGQGITDQWFETISSHGYTMAAVAITIAAERGHNTASYIFGVLQRLPGDPGQMSQFDQDGNRKVLAAPTNGSGFRGRTNAAGPLDFNDPKYQAGGKYAYLTSSTSSSTSPELTSTRVQTQTKNQVSTPVAVMDLDPDQDQDQDLNEYQEPTPTPTSIKGTWDNIALKMELKAKDPILFPKIEYANVQGDTLLVKFNQPNFAPKQSTLDAWIPFIRRFGAYRVKQVQE